MDQVKTGNFLKALRRERGWTQSQFAEKLQISEKTVSKWETGRGLPDVALALVLVAALCDLPVWTRILLIVCAILGICAVLAPILLVAVSVEVFSCPACGKRFVPTLRAYILGPHTFRKRRLKCPHCGKKSWCASSLRAEDVSPERRETD